MIPIPKLPAVWIIILGALDAGLVAAQPHLPSPWGPVVGIILAILTALGVGTANVAIAAHATKVRAAARQELGR